MRNIAQDQVSISLNAEESLSSDTVKVTVGVVMSTRAEDAGNVRASVLEALKGVIDIDWRFSRLDRRTDRSGLEVVEASATARVPEQQVAGLTARTKEQSREGLQLSVEDIDYNPTQKAIDEATTRLRKRIYELAQAEATLLGEMLPADVDGTWRVSGVQFGHSYAPGQAQNMRGGARIAAMSNTTYLETAGGGDDGGFDLTQKVRLEATVTLARIAAK